MRAAGGGQRAVEIARIFTIVLLAYTSGVFLAWTAFGAAMGPAFFYPSAGISVAALILTRRSTWPVVVAAIVLGESLLDFYFWSEPSLCIGFALANAAEPLVGASLVLWWCGGRPDLNQRRDFFLFLAAACVAGPAVGGLIGGTTTALFLDKDWIFSVLTWWAGDALGVLVIASPILLWQRQSHIVKSRPVEACSALVVTAALSVTALHRQISPSMFVLPVIALAALRLGMLGAGLSGAVFAFSTNVMTSRGKDIFGAAGLSAGSTVAVTQLYVGVTTIIGLLFAQEVTARTKAVREQGFERRERLRLEGLSRLAQRLSAALDVEAIGRALEDHVLNEAGAKAFNLGLLNPKGTRLEWVVMAGYPPEVVAEFGSGMEVEVRYLTTDSVRTGRPVLARTVADYRERYGESVRFLDIAGAQSVVAWPLVADGTTIGTLVLMWSEPQTLDEAQLAYISTVATMTSQALIRARIYTDDRARAAVLQAAVLPSEPGDVDGVDLHVSYEPADETLGLGSDWYDVMTLPRGRVYLAVGDVKGRGLDSVEDMGQLRSAGRALALQGLPPSRVLEELNSLILDASHSEVTTMVVAVYDAEAATVSHSAAGHPPGILRSAGSVSTLSGAVGPALGSAADSTYVDGTVSVEPGDILVMYTDGLDDGTSRAQGAIAVWDLSRSLRDACESLHVTLAPRPREDDVCILAVRFEG